MFLITLAVAAAVVVFTSTHTMTRLLGWAWLAVFLLVRRQRTLFWIHVAIPIVVGCFAFLFGVSDSRSFSWGLTAPRGSWMHLAHCVADAGMFLTLITLPFSFLGVDD